MEQQFSNVVAAASSTREAGGRVFAASIDWRHYFYQLPAGAPLTGLFPIELDADGVAVSNAMPMGFSWSPYLGQCGTWALVLGCNRTGAQPWFFKLKREDLRGPPPWLPLFNRAGTQVGAVFVLLDNVYIFGHDEAVVQACLDWTRANCRDCGVWEKPQDAAIGRLPEVVILTPGSDATCVECFGIEFSGLGFRVL
jgi:hypothetical protein